MKFLVNISLVITILAVIILPSGVCQEKPLTNETMNETMDETSTYQTSTHETSTHEAYEIWNVPRLRQQSIIVVPNRNIDSHVCPEGQRKDNRERCRQIL